MAKLPSHITAIVEQMIKQGYKQNPHALLEEINGYIQRGEPLPVPLRAYFEQSIKSNDLNKGFGLKPSRSHGQLDRLIRDVAIYRAVLNTGLPRHKEEDGAFYEVSEEFNLSPSTIEKAFYQHEKRFPKNESD